MESKVNPKREGRDQIHNINRRLSKLERRCSAVVVTSLIDVVLILDERLDELEQRTSKGELVASGAT